MKDATRTSTVRRTPNRLSRAEIALIVIVLLGLLAAVLISGRSAEVKVGTSSITVHAGESLWTIAQEHPVEGLSTAQTVQLIMHMNDLADSTIAAGRPLHVPVPASASSDLLAMR